MNTNPLDANTDDDCAEVEAGTDPLLANKGSASGGSDGGSTDSRGSSDGGSADSIDQTLNRSGGGAIFLITIFLLILIDRNITKSN